MSEKDNTDAWGKILIGVIIIMAFLWWRSDNQRIKWIHELQETIEVQEQRIEDLERALGR